MTDFFSYTSLAVSLVSFLLSLTAVVIQYAKRHEHPLITPLEMEIASMKGAIADLIDRVEHFVRRDRTRRARAEASGETEGSISLVPGGANKADLRRIARERGLIR